MTDGGGADGASFSSNQGLRATRNFSVEFIGGVSCNSAGRVSGVADDSADGGRSDVDCVEVAVSAGGAAGVCAWAADEVA